ncbi:MAG: adenylate/guanylate cyclase domain-containing protein [Planctomycetales bacterium]|nr:adenylate/guanylate cyclase domain-containing protein [Planctomycetales bacterium]
MKLHAASQVGLRPLDLVVHNDEQHWQLSWLAPEFSLQGGVLEPWGVTLADSQRDELEFKVRRSEKSSLSEPQSLTVDLENHGKVLHLESGKRLYQGEQRQLILPTRFSASRSSFEVVPQLDPMIAQSLSPVGRDGSSAIASHGSAPSAATLAHWFESLGHLQRCAAGSSEFFQACACALVEPGGLDSAMILQLREGNYDILASRIEVPELGAGFDRTVVDEVARTGVAHYSDPLKLKDLPREEAERYVIGAPFFDASRNVKGVVFGMRGQHRHNSRRGIRPLEAQFVSLVADAVTAGTIRIEHETNCVRRQVLLEQAFPPSVARRLVDDPGILQAKRTEVSVLFVDLRDSTTITQTLPPEKIYGLLGDLMNEWTRSVLETSGSVLDYFGDGLAAFWNAPIEQPEHAQAATLAAMAIMERLPLLQARWESDLGYRLRLGVGVHTGEAVIGNAGSEKRLKYGPRGEAIHAACRIEAATKQLRVPILISESTANRLIHQPLTRRIGRVLLPGIADSTHLFEPLPINAAAPLLELRERYQEALVAYEEGQLASAWATLRQLKVDFPADGASQWLLERVEALVNGKIDRRRTDSLAPYVPQQHDEATS